MVDKKSGFFLVNKPSGISSYDVIREFKKYYPGQKIGHAGTLDPAASGLLIVLMGKTCKEQIRFMGLEKEYRAKIVFGLTSDTYDLQGQVKISDGPDLFKNLSLLTKDKVKKALAFFGKGYLQTVPAFSAVKRKGKPLYKLAREGKKIKNLPQKEVKIGEIRVVSFKEAVFPQVELLMKVSKGFYVRSLAFDLGKKLGVGGVLASLVRTKIGNFSLQKAIELKDIRASEDQS